MCEEVRPEYPVPTTVKDIIAAAEQTQQDSEYLSLTDKLCDLINTDERHAIDAASEIHYFISNLVCHPSFEIANRTITLLEACVSRCSDKKFLEYVMNRSYLDELVEMIRPTNLPSPKLYIRIITLLEQWFERFNHGPYGDILREFLDETEKAYKRKSYGKLNAVRYIFEKYRLAAKDIPLCDKLSHMNLTEGDSDSSVEKNLAPSTVDSPSSISSSVLY